MIHESVLLIGDLGFTTSFISVFLLGETAIITLLTTYKQNSLGLETVILICTLATLAADIFWFAVGRYFPSHNIPDCIKKRIFLPINSFFTKLTNERIFTTLLLLKFLIGFRIALMLHLSRQPISWTKLIVYDIFGTIVYISTITTISIGLNTFFDLTLSTAHTLGGIMTGLIIILLLSKLIYHKISVSD